MMCNWGTYTRVRALIPNNLSHTGQARWDTKPIDSCIADIVDALNKAGIYTSSSCCGHGKTNGEIWLHDGRKLAVNTCQIASNKPR